MNKSSWQLYVLWLVRYYFRLWFWRNGTSNHNSEEKIPSSLNLHSIMSHVCLVLVHWTLGMASPYFSSLKQESKWDLSSPTRWRRGPMMERKTCVLCWKHVNGGHIFTLEKVRRKYPPKRSRTEEPFDTENSMSIQFEHLEVMWLKLLG